MLHPSTVQRVSSELHLDGNILALGSAADEEKKQEDLLAAKSVHLDPSLTSRVLKIGITGMCHVLGDCATCVANHHCAWCAQPWGLMSEGCVPKESPCPDLEYQSCSVALLRKVKQIICSEESPLSKALEYWGYDVNNYDQDDCFHIVGKECGPGPKRVRFFKGEDDCDVLSKPLRAVPAPPRLAKKILVEEMVLQHQLERQLEGSANVALAHDLVSWRDKARTSSLCVTNLDTGIVFAQVALKVGCLVIGITDDVDAVSTSPVPKEFVFKRDDANRNYARAAEAAMNDPQPLHRAYAHYFREAEVLYRRKVRQFFSNNVHVVTIVRKAEDVPAGLGFLMTTLGRLPYASVEIMMCPPAVPQFTSKSLESFFAYLTTSGIMDSVTLTKVDERLCKDEDTILNIPINLPSPHPDFVLLAFHPGLIMLNNDIISVLATGHSLQGPLVWGDNFLFTDAAAFSSDECLQKLKPLSYSDLAERGFQRCNKGQEPTYMTGKLNSVFGKMTAFAAKDSDFTSFYAVIKAVSDLCRLEYFSHSLVQAQLPGYYKCEKNSALQNG
ncbi:hypothetical protein DIPPA_12008 [Diplonema papillatum]|nr:hypothetical protein DIPPA_12008 [Diplonema papillatum]